MVNIPHSPNPSAVKEKPFITRRDTYTIFPKSKVEALTVTCFQFNTIKPGWSGSFLICKLDQTLFRAGAYNLQSISAVGGKAVWPRETRFNLSW